MCIRDSESTMNLKFKPLDKFWLVVPIGLSKIPPLWVQSIALSVSVCLSVCLYFFLSIGSEALQYPWVFYQECRTSSHIHYNRPIIQYNMHLFSRRHKSLDVNRRCRGSLSVTWCVSTVKRCVLKADLKVSMLTESRIAAGMLFQTTGAETTRNVCESPKRHMAGAGR